MLNAVSHIPGMDTEAKRMGRPPRSDDERERMKEIGRRFRWLREVMGLSQPELVESLGGIHQTTWSYYERGKRLPDQFAMVRLAAKLKVSVAYFLEGSLEGVDRDLAIRLAAQHPELAPPTRKG